MTINTRKQAHSIDNQQRRILLGRVSVAALAPVWNLPMINAVVLPAHGQTSEMLCVTDTTVGGPLAGNAAGADNCADACAAEAEDQGAQLCAATETDTANGTDCSCELDLP